jgi:FtsP/CotA-like multicopper oxidase with cupredoxin domain
VKPPTPTVKPPTPNGTGEGIEWEDDMVEVNRLTTTANMHWKLVDRATGAENAAIDWRFRVGDRVKIRLVNEMDSDHPMHHPFHLHGAGRFLVLARNGVTEPNLVWKDTVLVRTGQSVNILFDVTEPGLWMAHCHIAEHMQRPHRSQGLISRPSCPLWTLGATMPDFHGPHTQPAIRMHPWTSW